VAGTRHRQDVLPQPAGQRGHVVGQSDGGRRDRPGVPELLAHAGLAPPPVPFARGLLAFQLGASGQRLVGPAFQGGDHGEDRLDHVEGVTAAGDLGQGQFVPGHEAAAAVADNRPGCQALLLQLQQAEAPGVGIAMRFRAQQVAVGGSDIDADQHRLARLEDLVVGTDSDPRQVLLPVAGAGPLPGGVGDAMDVPQRALAVEQVAEQLGDAAVRAVAHEQQRHDEPLQPHLGHRQVEEDPVVGRQGGAEGFGEGLVGPVGLPIDESAADATVRREVGDRPRPGEGGDRQGLPLGGPGRRAGIRDDGGWGAG
jgi:hypothetical protein